MKRPLLWLACACCIGIYLARYMKWQMICILCMAAFGAAVTQYVFVKYKGYTGKSRIKLFFPVFILIFSGYGKWYMQLADHARVQAEQLGIQEEGWITGRITWMEVGTEEKQRQIYLSDIQCNGGALPGTMLVYLPEEICRQQEMKIGQGIYVAGQGSIYGPARNPGQFEARDYYDSQKIYYCFYGETWNMIYAKSSFFRQGIWEFRQRLKYQLSLLVGEEETEIRAEFFAILLGDRRLLTEELRELYQIAGISHILAISGLHLSVLGLSLYQLLRYLGLGFWISGGVVGFGMGIFAYMVGASSSCLRAYVMLMIMLSGRCFERTYDRSSAMSAALLLLLLDSPMLLFQSGFLMSFGAVIAIIWIYPLLCRGFEKSRMKPLIFSAAIQLITLPLSAVFFYKVSLWGPIVNLIAIPCMTVLLICLLISVTVSFFLELTLARLLLQPAVWIIQLYRWIGKSLQSIPTGGMLITGKPRTYQLFFYMITVMVLIFLIFGKEDKGKKKGRKEKEGEKEKNISRGVQIFRLLLLLTAVVFLPQGLLIRARDRRQLEVVMLDVGQGDGVLVLCPDGTIVMIDGGSTSQKDIWKKVLEPALEYYGVSKIDMWFLTHPDWDHISGYVEGASDSQRKIPIKNLLLPAAVERETLWKEFLPESQENVYYIGRGDVFRKNGDNWKILCLGPEKGKSGLADSNAVSLILQIQYGENRILLCGDIGSEQERELLTSGWELRSDVLKVAHHGSKYGSSAAFLTEVSPDYAVISVGRNNYGHPSVQVLDRLETAGAQVLITKEQGAVVCQIGFKKGKVFLWYFSFP